MTVAIIITLTYLGSIFAKYFFWLANFNHKADIGRFVVDKAPVKSCFIPFYSFFTKIHFKEENYRLKFRLAEILGIASFFLVSIGFVYQFTNVQGTELFIIFLYFCIYLFSAILFTYISVFDILFFQITTRAVIFLLLFGILANILILLLRILVNAEIIISSLALFQIGNPLTFITFIGVYSLSYILVAVTKENYLGFGDVDIFAAVSLLLGLEYTIVFFLLFPIVGTIIGLSYSARVRKFRNLRIPLVPILYLTYLICLFFGDKLIEIVIV
ncbi:MAG: hypothetical protein Kow0081_2280 [Candidatus Dojkabacteria bacterium]